MPLPRLILLPGLGIDGRVFAPQSTLPARIEVPPWLAFSPGESLPAYAARLAETIDPTPPFFVGGISFGAMLAQEIAPRLRPRAVLLISGCQSSRQLATPLRIACQVAPKLSDAGVRHAIPLMPLFLRVVGRPDRRQRQLLLQLLDNVDPHLTRHGAAAIGRWTLTTPPAAPTYHVHGSDDHVIPAGNVRRSTTLLVRGGGHVVNVTHADVVNHYFSRILAAHQG